MLAVGLLAGLLGCGGARQPERPPVPEPDRAVVLRPHWDQVCWEERGPLLLRTPGEVLEAADLLEALEGSFPSVVPAAVGSIPPFVDVAVNYDRSGALRTAHLLDHNVDEDLARDVSALVTAAVRDPVRVLAPVRLRIRVSRDRGVHLAVLPALACMPHIAHEDDEPPRLLGGARVTGGVSRSARLRLDATQVAVGLDISADGELGSVWVRGGNAELAPRVRMALAGVRIDPALLNGEPVSGSLLLIFRFPDEEGVSRPPPPPPGPAPTPGRRPPP
jgi:hypothetical protein